ncbi:hypothetical protein ABVK25_000737 [Lepraria finkii]|uniref:Uncharacterized protein n=1 Tax=Lepraria finkii TaxID=1340010 RepID=A0ABR4BNR7_9LECA
MITHQSLNLSAQIDTNERLSDIQVSEVMNIISRASSIDAMKSLQYCVFMRNRRSSRPGFVSHQFWLEEKFRKWKSMPASSLVMVKGSYTSRFEIKNFCVDAIQLLRDARVPIVWALRTTEQDAIHTPSVTDILKNLIRQVLRLNILTQNERSLALNCSKFHGAETEVQWFDLLGSVLAGLPQIYIIVDVEAASPIHADSKVFSWPLGFLDVFKKLSERGLKTIVKVVLVSYGCSVFQDLGQKDLQDHVISVGRAQSTSLVRRGKVSSRQRGMTDAGRGYGRGRREPFAF